MKIVLLSDIHGNLPAFEAVLSHAARQSIDRYLVAGDIVVGP
jgi:predicted phosphodiesterase